MEEPQNNKVRQLLEQLQEESWQLELLISGFAIFLVAASWQSLQNLLIRVQVISMGIPDSTILNMSVFILLGSWFFLLANLILHVVMRGLWISAIGLRYVSGDVDFEKLRFAPVFDRYLRKRIPSFDHFIARLEKICSVVFAFTFLIIFLLVALGLFVAFSMLFDRLLEYVFKAHADTMWYTWLDRGTSLVIALTSVVYFLDFITLGWIKRIKWLSRVYYPFYRFYSWVTLSFLYRPLYYNLIDDKFGRRVVLLIIPYMIVVGSLASNDTETHLYYPSTPADTEISHRYYDDVMEDDMIIKRASIQSKYIQHGFLEVFVPYVHRDNAVVDSICPGIKPDKTTGLRFGNVSFSANERHESPEDSLLLCVAQLTQVYVDDSLYNAQRHHFYIHPNHGERGILRIIDIAHLDRGMHHLRIEKREIAADTLRWKPHERIPFWKQ